MFEMKWSHLCVVRMDLRRAIDAGRRSAENLVSANDQAIARGMEPRHVNARCSSIYGTDWMKCSIGSEGLGTSRLLLSLVRNAARLLTQPSLESVYVP